MVWTRAAAATLVRGACRPRGRPPAAHQRAPPGGAPNRPGAGALRVSHSWRGDVAWLAFARGGAPRAFQYGTFEEFISGGGVGMEARSLVAYCFSVGDDFRFASAQRALTQAYSAPARIFFNEVVHISVPSDAVPTWPSEAVARLGSDEAPMEAPGTAVGGAEAAGPKADAAMLHAGAGGDAAGGGGGYTPGGGGEGSGAARESDGRDAASASDCDVFLFRDGSLVLWGMDADAEHGLLALLETFRPLQSDEASLSSRAGFAAHGAAGTESSVGVSKETLHWRYGTTFGFETRENRRGRGREMLVLSTPANILEKVALSHGMQVWGRGGGRGEGLLKLSRSTIIS